MDIQVLILNLSYLLVAVGLALRDMLVLRTVITISEALIIIYGVAIGNLTIAGWNVLFLVINTYQIIRLLLERRPVDLPSDIRDIYSSTFAGLSSREFLYFWHTGKMINVRETFLCRHNEPQDELMMIVDGVVSIRKNGREIATLERGDFVAEMSFLTGEPASADAYVDGKARCVVWSYDKLRQLEELDRDLLMKLQLVLGRDISHKLREAHPTKAHGKATKERST